MNAIEVLRADHMRLRSLLPRLYDVELAADERGKLREEVEKEIKIHAMIEEEIFYPAWKDATRTREDRDLYFESIEEHHVVDMLLPELMPMDPSSDGFRAKAKVLHELIDHHAKEEEEEMFPKTSQLFTPVQLDDLGSRLIARRNELEQEWSTTLGSALRKAQAVAEKFAPTALKDARVDSNRG